MRRVACALALVLVLVPLGAPSASAQEDAHGIYERRCHGCHVEHGADLARQKFRVDKDVLSVTRSGVRVDVLLRKHHGVTLTPPEASALVTLFKSGIKWAGVYQRLCARCHDKAVGFARERLLLREGEVLSRRNGVEVGAFLKQHGGATDEEIATLIEMLRYQLVTDDGKRRE